MCVQSSRVYEEQLGYNDVHPTDIKSDLPDSDLEIVNEKP